MKRKDKYSSFHFSQFSVSHKAAAHKVGTDSILLGSWAALADRRRILDVGTGCGLLSLMVTQRNERAQVVAIDVDRSVVAEAAKNVQHSSWANRIDVRHISMQELLKEDLKFDAIICNPPYFDHSYPIADERRRRARTTCGLTRLELFSGASHLLVSGGSLFVVLPTRTLDLDLSLASICGLHIQELLTVYPDQDKPSKITLVHLCSGASSVELTRKILIAGPAQKRSAAFRALTKDFYLY